MAFRFLILGALLLGLNLKPQAQLHVMPKTWRTPKPRITEKNKAIWRSVLTKLERDRLSLLQRPRTVANQRELAVNEKQIQTTRKMLSRNDKDSSVQSLSR
jgi:hypothetical protein